MCRAGQELRIVRSCRDRDGLVWFLTSDSGWIAPRKDGKKVLKRVEDADNLTVDNALFEKDWRQSVLDRSKEQPEDNSRMSRHVDDDTVSVLQPGSSDTSEDSSSDGSESDSLTAEFGAALKSVPRNSHTRFAQHNSESASTEIDDSDEHHAAQVDQDLEDLRLAAVKANHRMRDADSVDSRTSQSSLAAAVALSDAAHASKMAEIAAAKKRLAEQQEQVLKEKANRAAQARAASKAAVDAKLQQNREVRIYDQCSEL